MFKKKFDTRTLVTLSALTAIQIVLSRFLSFSVWNMKIGLGFIPVLLAAMLFGPVQAGVVAALGDFLGAILFPIGPYFPGFTLTAFLTGLVFGVFLHRERGVLRAVGAVAVDQLLLSLLLNSLWISILYGAPYWPLLVTRLLQCGVMGAAQLTAILGMDRVLLRYGKKAAV